MALSGQLPGEYVYDNTHYYFIRWTATQNIANNSSTVTAELCVTLKSNYGSYSPNSYSQIVLDGTTYSVPYNSALKNPGAGTHVLGSYSKALSHGSDGSKTFTLSGRHNKSGKTNYCNFPAQSFTLDTIPRATEITGFSNFNSDSTSVSVTLDRKSSAFSHDISLILGGTTIATWTGSTANFTGTKALSLTTAQRNALLAKLPTATSGTATLKVITKNSGGTAIGTKTKTATYSILAAVKPTISGVTTTIATPKGAVSGKTRSYAIQNISTVKIGYTGTAPHGTTISSATVKLGDAAATSSNPGSFVPAKSGSVPYTITVKDKRGRVTTATGSVSVTAYGGLAAQLIHVQRPQGANEAQNKMTVRVRLTVPSISSSNAFNVKITSKPVDGSSGTSTPINLTYNPGNASNSLYNYNPSMTYLETKAYDVTIVVKDDFKTVTLAGRLSTASFPFVLGPDGVGFGKIPEPGRVLDVGGTIYAEDILLGGESVASLLAENEYSGYVTVNQSVVSGNVRYYKRNGIVTLAISHSSLAEPLASYGTAAIFTLPGGFRPPIEVWGALTFDSNAHTAVSRIYANGNVSIHSRQNTIIPTSTAFRGILTFPAIE